MATTFKIKNGDWVEDRASGQALTVTGLNKTKQDFNELLSIEMQTNGFGASIVELVGSVPDNPLSVSFDLMRRISDAVTRWIGLQRRQKAILSDDEVVTRLSFNQAKVDENDPTTVIFRSTILVRSGDEISKGGKLSTVM